MHSRTNPSHPASAGYHAAGFFGSLWKSSEPARPAAAPATPAAPVDRVSFERIQRAEQAAFIPLIEPGLIALLRSQGGDNVKIDVQGDIAAAGVKRAVSYQLRTHTGPDGLRGEVLGTFADQDVRLSFNGMDRTVRVRGKIGENLMDVSHSLNAMRGNVFVGGMVGRVAVDLFLNGSQTLQISGSLDTSPYLLKVRGGQDSAERRISGRVGQEDFSGTLTRTAEGEYLLSEARDGVVLTERIKMERLDPPQV